MFSPFGSFSFILVHFCVSIYFVTSENVPPELLKVFQKQDCSSLKSSIQKNLVAHRWNLENLRFQQRLKKFPKYIVTLQRIEPVTDPLVEVRCPTKENPKLEIIFHETRFQAGSCRLFDIQSIFPIHTGSINVKLRIDPLVVPFEKTLVLVGDGIAQVPKLNDIYYAPPSIVSGRESGIAKEHREETSETNAVSSISSSKEPLVEVEKEIESIFVNRIKSDVQKQLRMLVHDTVGKFLRENLFSL